jgi:hypothetical protein
MPVACMARCRWRWPVSLWWFRCRANPCGD